MEIRCEWQFTFKTFAKNIRVLRNFSRCKRDPDPVTCDNKSSQENSMED